MKKLLLFLLAALAILSVSKKDLFSYASYFGGDYSVYTTEGEGVPVFSTDGESVYLADTLNDGVIGETITIYEGFTVDEVLRKIGSIYKFSADIDGIKILYGYSPMLKRITFVDNKPVNFQITLAEGIITLSNPVNYGSY